MSAVPKTKTETKPDDGRMGKLREAGKRAIDAALTSMEHTDTVGWQKLYADHAADVAQQRRDLGGRMTALAAGMERGMFGEDDEKALGDIKKASTELRAAIDHWNRQTVEPVRQCVYDFDDLKRNAIEDARSAEQREPLLNKGLADSVKAVLSQLPRVTWDAETGRVLVETVDETTGEVTAG